MSAKTQFMSAAGVTARSVSVVTRKDALTPRNAAAIVLLAGMCAGTAFGQSAPADKPAAAAPAAKEPVAPATVREAERPRVRVGGPSEAPGGAARAGGPGGPRLMGGDAPVTEPEAHRYADLLMLDEGQREAALALAQSTIAQHEEFREKQRAESDAIRERLRETGDPKELMESMPRIMEEMQSRSRELEESYLADLQLLLTPEQQERWPRVERQRRRDRTLHEGVLSGERVDLIRVVEQMELTSEDRAAAAPILEEYEVDLDRALIERNKVVQKQVDSMNNGGGMFGGDFGALMQELRDAGARVSEVNRAFTARLSEAMSEDAASRFGLSVKQTAFPRVYRKGLTASILDTAAGLEDLTPEQRAEVELVMARYQEQVQAANDRWARALADEEESGEVFNFAGGGQQTRIVLNAEEGAEELESAKARRERKELDERTRESIRSILTDAQRERLPKPPERRAPQFTTPNGAVVAVGGESEDDFDAIDAPEVFGAEDGAVMMITAVAGVLTDEDGNVIEEMPAEAEAIEIFELKDGVMVPVGPGDGKADGDKKRDEKPKKDSGAADGEKAPPVKKDGGGPV